MPCPCTNQITIENNCGCSQPTCQETNCGCKVYISSDCVSDVKADFNCLPIESHLSLTQTLEEMESAICDKFTEFDSHFDLINTGVGAQSYKGINILGQKQIRRINSKGGLILVVENTDDISIDINTDDLLDYIETNITFPTPTVYNATNVGTGAGVFKNKTVNTFNFKSLLIEKQGVGADILRDLQTNTDDLKLRTKSITTDGSVSITTTPTEIKLSVNPEWLDLQISAWLVNHSSDICDVVSSCSEPPIIELGTFGYSLDTLLDACNDSCTNTNTIAIYRNALDGFYADATQLATNALMTIPATAGYYAESGIVRYWNGINFVGTPEVCLC
jgi:hypothetical protein